MPAVLDGTRVVVTGATSGLGRAMADALSVAGAHVAVTSRHAERAASTARELGDRVGPINWQLAETKKFDAEDIESFFKLLPREVDGLPLRHALEVRNDTFKDERFYDLCRKHNVAIIFAHDPDFPEIDEPTADFTYARLMGAEEKVKTGYKPAELDKWAKKAKAWAKKGDAFIYFISGAKVRNPAAAQALIERV